MTSPTQPEPLRPLGAAGLDAWTRLWSVGVAEGAVELAQLACEQIDERVALRVTVLRDSDEEARRALRALDAQISRNLGALVGTTDDDAELCDKVGSGDRRKALEAMRDSLAAHMAAADSSVVAQVAARLQSVIDALAELPAEQGLSSVDEIRRKRENRRAKPAS